ncbi:MAG TPA: glycosyltransferase family 9 protein, partial [Rhodanobacteraceae bacterium]
MTRLPGVEAVRRRVASRAMHAAFHASDARLCHAGELAGARIRRVLICRPNHRLGNLLLLTPLLQELQHELPDARVDILAAGGAATSLFAGFDNVGRVYCLSRRIVRHPFATAGIVLQLRRIHYDLAIDPCEASQSSRLLASAVRARRTLGVLPQDLSSGALAEDPLCRMPRHMAHLPVWLLRRALRGTPTAPAAAWPPLSIRISAEETAQAHDALTRLSCACAQMPQRAVVGVFAEATGQKRYPRVWWERFIATFRTAHPDCTLLEILPPDGRPRLALQLPTFSSPNPRAVAALIARMDGFISADCGVMHLASAAGTPTLGLFSVTDAVRYQPYGHGSMAITTPDKTPEEIARLAHAWLVSLATGAPQTDAPC